MTVWELQHMLKNYPPCMNVKVAVGRQIADLNCVNFGVDMETNQESVWLCHEENEVKGVLPDLDIGDLIKFCQDYNEKMRRLLV